MNWPLFYILLAIVVFLLLPFLISITIVPPFIFDAISARKKPDKWSRNHPSSPNPGIVEMWGESLKFREAYKDKEQEIEATTQDGLHLKGLYYDFGSTTAVIIMGGRPETCIYSLYYAYPYAEKGVNVCVFDPRAHGESEGVYSGCGYKEALDLRAFANVLIEKGVQKIILHGICVGSCAATLFAAEPDCPPQVKGLFTDGAYINYYETLKHRIAKNKGPVYPTVWLFRHYIKKLHGVDCAKEGPLTAMPKLRIPCLMVASKEDIFSLPKNTELLFEANGSPDKRLEWFEHGPHSHLRRVDTAHYDRIVGEFVDFVQSR